METGVGRGLRGMFKSKATELRTHSVLLHCELICFPLLDFRLNFRNKHLVCLSLINVLFIQGDESPLMK